MYKSKSGCLVGTSRSYGKVSSNSAKKSALTSLEAVVPPSGCLSPLNQVFIQAVVGSKEHFASFSTISVHHVKYHLLLSEISTLERMRYFLIYQGQFQLVDFSRFIWLVSFFPTTLPH